MIVADCFGLVKLRAIHDSISRSQTGHAIARAEEILDDALLVTPGSAGSTFAPCEQRDLLRRLRREPEEGAQRVEVRGGVGGFREIELGCEITPAEDPSKQRPSAPNANDEVGEVQHALVRRPAPFPARSLSPSRPFLNPTPSTAGALPRGLLRRTSGWLCPKGAVRRYRLQRKRLVQGTVTVVDVRATYRTLRVGGTSKPSVLENANCSPHPPSCGSADSPRSALTSSGAARGSPRRCRPPRRPARPRPTTVRCRACGRP